MGKKALTYSAALIGLYLGVRYATGSGTLLKSGANGTAKIVRTFQGR